jgi:hypothetical protein
MSRIITENGQQYDIREGRRIKVKTIYGPTPKLRRKPFKTEWIRFPASWRETLRQANSAGTTYELALTILSEAFKRKHVGGCIVLSAAMTGMPRNTRRKAAKELARLGLIKLDRTVGNQAYRVSLLSI